MYWLFKEDPESYSFDRLVEEKKTAWIGVHNPLALKNLRQVKKGDLIFFYQTGDEKRIVGIMKASSNAYSSDKFQPLESSKEVSVDVVPVQRVKNPVSLSTIKSDPRFKDFLLVKFSRLSVMAVSEKQWEWILKLSETSTA
jgi:predicted RNA-binding protein with PUA-like domain